MPANHTLLSKRYGTVTEQALWDNVLEDVAAVVLKGLALINFGHFAQLCGH
jgi:hypothetical protein